VSRWTSGFELGQMSAKAANVLHVRGGKLTKLVIYFDRERALADLGLPSEARSRGILNRCRIARIAAARLARYQLDDRDDPSSLRGLLTEVGVLRINAVSKIPQSLPFGFVLNDLRTVVQTAENDVRMLPQVVVPRRVLRPPPQRCDDGHAIAVVEVERGIPT
jgi:hypothetical protein